MWKQKFAAGVTKLMPPDEIRRFDGIDKVFVNFVLATSCRENKCKPREHMQTEC